jgi:HEPN domain-containing protein
LDKPSRIVQEWFKFSRQDLLAAKTLMAANNPSLWSNVGFLCQQSSEKSIKGLLAYRKIKFGKTHEMEILGFELSKLYPDLTELMKSAVRLTPFAVEFRYPESVDRPLSAELVLDAIQLAESIYQEMSSRIPFESAI